MFTKQQLEDIATFLGDYRHLVVCKYLAEDVRISIKSVESELSRLASGMTLAEARASGKSFRRRAWAHRARGGWVKGVVDGSVDTDSGDIDRLEFQCAEAPWNRYCNHHMESEDIDATDYELQPEVA